MYSWNTELCTSSTTPICFKIPVFLELWRVTSQPMFELIFFSFWTCCRIRLGNMLMRNFCWTHIWSSSIIEIGQSLKTVQRSHANFCQLYQDGQCVAPPRPFFYFNLVSGSFAHLRFLTGSRVTVLLNWRLPWLWHCRVKTKRHKAWNAKLIENSVSK